MTYTYKGDRQPLTVDAQLKAAEAMVQELRRQNTALLNQLDQAWGEARKWSRLYRASLQERAKEPRTREPIGQGKYGGIAGLERTARIAREHEATKRAKTRTATRP